MHQAIRAGEHFGQISGFKQNGPCWKELFAIVCAVNTWGHNWARRKILFHCDNSAVISIWKKGLRNHNFSAHVICTSVLHTIICML